LYHQYIGVSVDDQTRDQIRFPMYQPNTSIFAGHPFSQFDGAANSIDQELLEVRNQVSLPGSTEPQGNL
jgi:hypothetical protein